MIFLAGGAEADYGALQEVVAGALAVMSAAASLGAWRSWDRLGLPDVGVSKAGKSGVGTVLNSVALVLVWYATRAGRYHEGLPLFAGILTAVVVMTFLILLIVVLRLRYEVLEAGPNNTFTRHPILGGLRLRPEARAEVRAGESVQDYLAGVAYQLKDVWQPWSLATARALVLFIYFVTVATGTVALTVAGRLVVNAQAGL